MLLINTDVLKNFPKVKEVCVKEDFELSTW